MVNEYFKIKLINPCRFEKDDLYSDPPSSHHHQLPYGMGILTSYLKKQGAYVEQDDLSVKFNTTRKWSKEINPTDLHINNHLLEEIRGFSKTSELSPRLERLLCGILNSTSIKGFDIIGFSIFTFWHFLFALLLSHKIKEFTNTPIVFGGPFITLQGQLRPDAFKFIDFMITGEGEMPLMQLGLTLIQKTSFERIPGLIYKHNGSLTVIPRDKYPIEEMPIPDFEGLPLDLYRVKDCYKSLYIPYQISKGCNGTCSFCNAEHINPFLEYKSYHKVVTELRQLKEKYSSNLFRFCDSSINNSYEYLKGLCKAFIDNKINIHWCTYARIGNLDKAILERMKVAGCNRLFFGVESGSDRMLRLMRKGFTSMQAQMILRYADEFDIQNYCCFISGLPHERKEDIRNTVDFIRRNKKCIDLARVYSFSLSYDSHIWREPETYGITNVREIIHKRIFVFDEIGGLRWQEKLRQQECSNKQIRRAIYKHVFRGSFFQKLIYFMKSRFFIRVAQKRGDK